jgi:hypothetical protein
VTNLFFCQLPSLMVNQEGQRPIKTKKMLAFR